MAEKTIAMTETQEERGVQPEGTRTRERYVSPPADIYEVDNGLMVMADVPGVVQAQLEVRVDNHVLTIYGQVSKNDMPESVYREYKLVSYFR
jgi:HSP20 family molecular chaperone IbpA